MTRLLAPITLLALLALAPPAWAAPSLLGPTGLLLIPTAETLGATQFNLGLSGIRADEGPDQSILYGNVGLLPEFELGFTREKPQNAGAETLLNAKVRLLRPPLGKLSLAAGMMDISNQIDRTPYLVLSHTLGAGLVRGVGPVELLQIHLGVGGGRLDGLFGGVSLTINHRLQVMAEYDSEHVNIGARIPLALKLDATLAALDGFEELAAGLSFSGPW
jgi:hypothetical protein